MDVKRKLEVMKEIDEANKRHLREWKEQQDQLMLAVYVDVYGDRKVKKVRIARDLEEYYRLIDCTTVDMPMRYIGGKQFVIICDDEGTFRSDCKPSALDGENIMLVGNLLVVAFDGREDIRGLTEAEADHVLKHVGGIGKMDDRGRVEMWQVLKGVKYRRDD